MAIDPRYIGATFRQLSEKLEIGRLPGHGPARDSRRPRRNNGVFTDTDNPTLITFEEGDDVDVAALLRIGAIRPWTPPSNVTNGGETIIRDAPKGSRRRKRR